jgi:HK97 family phage major capsid protein
MGIAQKRDFFMHRNQLLQDRAALQKKLDGYIAQGPNALAQPLMQDLISECRRDIAAHTKKIDSIDEMSDFNGDTHASPLPVGSDFGWPGSGSRNGRRSGSLAEAMAHATDEQREQLKAFAAYLRGRDVSALSNLAPSGDGGFLIPSFVASALERNYSQFSPVADNARIFSTETGADEVFPVLSDSESGEQIDSAALTGADATVSGDTPPTSLTGPVMHAYKISSKPVFVPRETFTDSDIDIVQEVLGSLLARIVRFENTRYTRGSGSGQAQGFLTACSLYEGFDTLDLDVCLDLAYHVPALYRSQGAYMMSDTTAKYLRKLVTGISGDKRKLWADADFTKGTPATLHGWAVIINNDMTDVSSNGLYTGGTNSPIAFGDWKRFLVRQAENGQPFVYRYSVPAKDGSGLIAFRRSDSRVLVPEAIASLNPSGS